MPRRANTQTQQEAVQENAAVQADAGADMQMEAAITKTQPEKGVLALADVKIGDFMTIRNVRIKEDDYGLTVAMPKTKAGANEQYDIVNIGLHFFHKDVRLYAASCSEV